MCVINYACIWNHAARMFHSCFHIFNRQVTLFFVTLFLISFSEVKQVPEGSSSSLNHFNNGGFKLLLYAGGGLVWITVSGFFFMSETKDRNKRYKYKTT